MEGIVFPAEMNTADSVMSQQSLLSQEPTN